MESNMYSGGPVDELAALATAVEGLAAQDLAGLPDATRAERVLLLRRLLDRLEGHWLQELAAVDARGAAGADQGTQAASTAGWLRGRLRMGAAAASGYLRTAQALTDGELSAAHATVLAVGTQELPAHTAAEAEPVLVAAARRLDPPRLRRSSAICGWSPTPTPPPAGPSGSTSGGACGWPPPWRAWSPWTGCWTQRPARSCWPPGAAGPPGRRRGRPQRRSATRRRPL